MIRKHEKKNPDAKSEKKRARKIESGRKKEKKKPRDARWIMDRVNGKM